MSWNYSHSKEFSKARNMYYIIVSIISIVFPEEKHKGLEVAEAPVPKLRLRAAGCLRSDATHRSHSHDWMNLDDLWESKWINYCTSTIQYLKLKRKSKSVGQDGCDSWDHWNNLEQLTIKRSDLEASVVDVVRMFWSVLAVSADPKNRLCRHYISSSVESKLSPTSYDSYDVWTSLKHLPGNYRMDVRPLALPADGFGAALASLFSWMPLNYIQSWITARSYEVLVYATHIFSVTISTYNPFPRSYATPSGNNCKTCLLGDQRR